MISILKILSSIFIVSAGFFLVAPESAWAQRSLTLSVSPTLFEMTANPSQQWKSTVRVINSNPYDINVDIKVSNFKAQGETGQVKFLPLFSEEASGRTLAEWIKYEVDEIVIPAEQTLEIPFTIVVPEDADPGGHFAAIMIGTKSLDTGVKQTLVETSQVVTSLIFLRVTGEVDEQGQIREFSSVDSLTESPEMSFELRFENKGNVQILPQGEIKILNMWGHERGVIPVNRHTMFGNVLPKQIRKYNFSWSGEWSWADMGRYTAVATLAYGDQGRKFTTRETNFWVIPWRIFGAAVLSIIAFMIIITWAIRMYIRKMLSISGLSPEVLETDTYEKRHSSRKVSVVAPIEEGILDLRHKFKNSETWQQKIASIFIFAKQYQLFFVVTMSIIFFIATAVWYVQSASVDKRAYEVTIGGLDNDIIVSSEQVEYETKKKIRSAPTSIAQKSAPPIIIVNQSGVSGLAADLGLMLEDDGYVIKSLTNDFMSRKDKTVIVYSTDFTDEALQLNSLIKDSLLSAFADAAKDAPITIYVGKNYENEVQ